MKDWTDLLARILLAGVFLYEAVDSFIFFHDVQEAMTIYGLTWKQDLLLGGAIVLLSIGGILFLLGYRMGLAGLLVLMYWIPVTFIVYSFWNDPREEIRLNAIIFAKNLAIAGGVLLLMIKGSGKFSIKRLEQVSRIPKGDT